MSFFQHYSCISLAEIFRLNDLLLHFPMVLTNRLNKTKSAVFFYCRFSPFSKSDPFSRLLIISFDQHNSGIV